MERPGAERVGQSVCGSEPCKSDSLVSSTVRTQEQSGGAGCDDVGLKLSINKGLIPGPRMIVAGRAIYYGQLWTKKNQM
jgi:hypothetical protein